MRKVTFWLSILLIFLIPWEDVTTVGSLGTLARATGLLVAACWAAMILTTGRFRKLRPFHLVAYLFVLWNIVSVLWSWDVDGTIERIKTYAQLLVLVIITWELYDTPVALLAGLQSYILGAFVLIGSTVSNYLAGIETAVYSGGRYAATGFNANDMGLILALGIPVAWHLAVSSVRGTIIRRLKPLNLVYIPLATMAILLSGSRGSMIAAAPAFFYILWSLRRLSPAFRALVFVVLVAGLLASFSLVPQSSLQRLATTGSSISDADLGGRVSIWRDSIAVFSRQPLLGVGSGAFRVASVRRTVTHNVFLSILAELGIVGFTLFVALLAISVYEALNQPKLYAGLWLTTLSVWMLGALVHTWEYRKQTWLFLGLAVVSSALWHQETEPGAQTRLPARLDVSVAGQENRD